MLIAARKHFRTEEDYVAELDEKTGAMRLFAVKKVVEQVTDPQQRDHARSGREDQSRGHGRLRGADREAHRCAGTHCRADRQAGDLSESPRGGA